MYWTMLMLALTSASFAAEPSTVLEADGTVEVRLVVDASTAEIRKVLADTNGIFSTLNTDIYETETRKRDPVKK